jgi:hypothetical protein
MVPMMPTGTLPLSPPTSFEPQTFVPFLVPAGSAPQFGQDFYGQRQTGGSLEEPLMTAGELMYYRSPSQQDQQQHQDSYGGNGQAGEEHMNYDYGDQQAYDGQDGYVAGDQNQWQQQQDGYGEGQYDQGAYDERQQQYGETDGNQFEGEQYAEGQYEGQCDGQYAEGDQGQYDSGQYDSTTQGYEGQQGYEGEQSYEGYGGEQAGYEQTYDEQQQMPYEEQPQAAESYDQTGYEEQPLDDIPLGGDEVPPAVYEEWDDLPTVPTDLPVLGRQPSIPEPPSFAPAFGQPPSPAMVVPQQVAQPAPVPASRPAPAGDFDDDLGFGNKAHKPKVEDTPQPKEEAKPEGWLFRYPFICEKLLTLFYSIQLRRRNLAGCPESPAFSRNLPADPPKPT